jgi:signal transduction histidine kinase
VTRFFPRSLSSQIALVMVAALVVASAVNFIFILGERSRAALIETSGPAVTRFVDVVQEVIANPDPQQNRGAGFGFGGRMRGGRFLISNDSPVDQRRLPRDAWIEGRMTKALQDADVHVITVRAAIRAFDANDRLPGERVLRGPGQGGFGPGGPGPGGFGGPGGPQGGVAPDPGGPGSFPPGRFGQPDAIPTGTTRQPGPNSGDARFDPRLDPRRNDFRPPPGGGPAPGQPGGPPPGRTILLSAQLADGRWVSGDFYAPEPPRGEVLRLAASTFVLFAFVLAAALWVASLLSRPLRDLKNAASKVGASAPEQVPVRGPSDVRQTLEAFNAMSRRVSQLLGEKDVMLGALGHDLRTPLSSLRIRLETMEPEAERLKAVKTIEETNRLLEDILELARQGRSSEPASTMDLAILVDDMVEDYAETGAPVELAFREKSPATLRPILFRRLLRNLIDNAVKYGGCARVSVRKLGGEIEIRVDDDGPGMSPEALAAATQPFVRGDASRSRSTGGAGLGLALSEYIARNHGGLLILENRSPKGFTAAVRLPAAAPAAP